MMVVKRGHDDRQRDLTGALDAGFSTGQAFAMQSEDVLGHNYRVVYQQAHRDHQCQQSQNVEGLPGEVHDRQCDDDTHRNRQGDDESHAEPTQEEKQHQQCDDPAHFAAREKGVEGLGDDIALIEQDAHVDQLQTRITLHLLDDLLHPPGDLQCVGVALLVDSQGVLQADYWPVPGIAAPAARR